MCEVNSEKYERDPLTRFETQKSEKQNLRNRIEKQNTNR